MDEQLIQQLEQALADLKAGDEAAQEQAKHRLADLLGGDLISVGNIENSRAVAIGKDISIVIKQTLPDNLLADLQSLLDSLRGIPEIRARIDGQFDLRSITPYLNILHHDAMQSGLLRTLDPLTKDPTLAGQQVTVDQVYTPLDTNAPVTSRDNQGRPFTVYIENEVSQDIYIDDDSPLSAMEAADFFERLVILGDPGSGKSTFVGFLSLCLTGHYLDMENGWLDRLRDQGWSLPVLLPVLVTLRDFAQDMGAPDIHGTAQSLLDHIAHQMEKCGCPEAFRMVKEALLDGNALLILDGLDEVPADSRIAVRDSVTQVMRAFVRCRVLVTCRILSYTNPEWRIPDTDQVALIPFDEEKIQHFVRAWYTASQARGIIDSQKAQDRITDLTTAVTDPMLREMAGNPMLLTVMAVVHNHYGALPQETAKLYHECVELLMLRWRDREAAVLKDRLGVQDNDLYRALWKLAYDAHDRQGEREGAADISEAEIVFSLRDILGGLENAEAFCNYVEHQAGLLYGRGTDRSGVRIFAFPHRTFQEYLAGCHIASSSGSFNRQVGEKARSGEKWRQVLLLAAGQTVFVKNDIERPIDAVARLLKLPADDAGWQAVWLAGDMILVIGPQRLATDEIGQDVLPLARERLAALVSEGHLDPVERAAAGRTLSHLGDPRPGVGLREDGLPNIEWLPVKGTDVFERRDHNDKVVGTFSVPDFQIAKYPVTYAQFQAFIDDPDGWGNPAWWEGLAAGDRHKSAPREQRFKYDNHPRENVSWYDAVAFCRWLDAKVRNGNVGARRALPLPSGIKWGADWHIRLPTEWEWQWAATGGDGREYPYPGKFDASRGNTRETGIGQTSAVGIFPQGVAPCGTLDMSGNVWEWCLNEYDDPTNVNIVGNNPRVLRGGSWNLSFRFARASYRFRLNPSYRNFNFGFRVCCGGPPSQ